MVQRSSTTNRVEPGSGATHRLKGLVSDCKITIGDEDSPATNERLITFAALDLESEPIEGYAQATVSIHSATFGAFDGDESLDMDGSGPIGTMTNVMDGTSSAAFTVALIISNSSGVIAVIVNDAGNDTFFVRIDYGAGLIFETGTFAFGSG